MDPNANAIEQNRITDKIHNCHATMNDLDRLEDLRDALAEWLSRGGFAPSIQIHSCSECSEVQ